MTSSATAQAATADPGSFTNYTWAALVLVLIGAPVTQNNLNNFTTWMTAENGSGTWTGTAGRNNPLNNGLGSGGGSGLGSYADLATAAEYAAKGVEGGIQGAAPIGQALKANAPFSVFKAATINSGWASSHYAGSGYASLSSAAPPPAVSVSASGSHSTTHNPSVGNPAAASLSAINAASATGAANLGGGNTGNILTGGLSIPNPLSWTDALAKAFDWLTTASNWERLGMGGLGFFLFIIGLVGFISTTGPGQTAKSDIGPAVKDAAAAAVVA